MPTIAAFLLSITGSLVARAFVSLGFGLFSYAALTTVASTVISSAQSQYGSIGVQYLQFLNLGGVGQAMGIIAAAFTTRAALTAIKKLRLV